MKYLLLGLPLLAVACTNVTTLINDEGRRAHCGYSAWGLIGNAIAIAAQQACLSDARAAGYHAIGEGRATPTRATSAQ